MEIRYRAQAVDSRRRNGGADHSGGCFWATHTPSLARCGRSGAHLARRSVQIHGRCRERREGIAQGRTDILRYPQALTPKRSRKPALDAEAVLMVEGLVHRPFLRCAGSLQESRVTADAGTDQTGQSGNCSRIGRGGRGNNASVCLDITGHLRECPGVMKGSGLATVAARGPLPSEARWWALLRGRKDEGNRTLLSVARSGKRPCRLICNDRRGTGAPAGGAVLTRPIWLGRRQSHHPNSDAHCLPDLKWSPLLRTAPSGRSRLGRKRQSRASNVLLIAAPTGP